jgi:hypothetical protein
MEKKSEFKLKSQLVPLQREVPIQPNMTLLIGIIYLFVYNNKT